MSEQPPEPPAAGQPPSFEDALERLEAIVRELEEGQHGLDEALARYEEGVKLLRRCHDLLRRAERRIEVVAGLDAEGNPIAAPFEEPPLSLEEKSKHRSRRRSSGSSLPPSEDPSPNPDGPMVD
jgi:exodeoxyribonuclease VII small subunit